MEFENPSMKTSTSKKSKVTRPTIRQLTYEQADQHFQDNFDEKTKLTVNPLTSRKINCNGRTHQKILKELEKFEEKIQYLN